MTHLVGVAEQEEIFKLQESMAKDDAERKAKLAVWEANWREGCRDSLTPEQVSCSNHAKTWLAIAECTVGAKR